MARVAHIGRNDPCSCGSGKKFKKCCEKKAGTSRGTMLMAAFIGLILIGGILAAVKNFSTDAAHTVRTSGVWDPVHGHYH